MISTPVLIAIAVLAVIGITIGVVLVGGGSRTAHDSAELSSAQPASETLGLKELARRLQLPIDRLQEHQCTYRTAEVPKPNGGVRRLEIPDDPTKALQRRILRYLLNSLNAHPLACGFEPDTSIVHAAQPHTGKAVIVKMDVRRFFESTSADRVQTYLQEIGWDEEAAVLLTRLTTNNGHLPQGAPTSPRLSNLVNARMDEALLRVAKRHDGSYSRYADDITMSFSRQPGRRLRGLSQLVRRILKMYGYTMHGGKKLKILRRHQQQTVLGLVVNTKVALPRKTRRRLRAVKHHRETGRPTTLSEQQIRGWESLERMVKDQRDD